MKHLTYDGETYWILFEDQSRVSAVRAMGKRDVRVLIIHKATGEIEAKTRTLAWLNQSLRQEAAGNESRMANSGKDVGVDDVSLSG